IDANGSAVDEGTPKASPTVASAAPVETDEWTHLAATYDGARLVLFVNGTEVSAQTCNLVPANGTISFSAAPTDNVRSYTFRQAPIVIGGTPADGWFANLAAVDTEKAFTDL
ncbi:LamG-like jellyroll fold domain-containing protein, partial [Parabacteroides distasonis]